MESYSFSSGLVLGVGAAIVLALIGSNIARVFRDWREDMSKPWSQQSVNHLTADTPWQILMNALKAFFSCLIVTMIVVAVLIVSVRWFIQ